MAADYDAIIVGARCAGAPTAMLLARHGYRVLVVDRASFPSDTVSTHMIHAPGTSALHRWGLLEEVTATGCPAVERYSFDFGPVHDHRYPASLRWDRDRVRTAPDGARQDPRGRRRPRWRRDT